MITISKPRITEHDSYTRMSADISIDGDMRTVWFEVEAGYGKYLCHERCDGFVVGILKWAMVNGHDITCEAPVGEYLYYNLTEHFIISLSRNSKTLHRTRIIAEVDSSTLENAGAVGTGFSGGIDSFHGVANNCDPKLPQHKITHLAFYNVGSNQLGNREKSRKLFIERSAKSRQFAKEHGYEFVYGDSNIVEQFRQEHFFVHIYSNMFAVFCLQKLYAIYYYASTNSYSDFSLRDNELHSPDHYELLSVFCFSTDTLKVYSEGGSITRFEKTRIAADYLPSYKYLNVCITTSENCGVCHKCRRTIMDLYALGSLEKYRDVFDVEYFNRHKSWYLSKTYAYYLNKDRFAMDSYEALRKEMTFFIRIKAIPTYFSMRMNGKMKRVLIGLFGMKRKIFS